jgi:hypothetical protein
MKDVDRSKLYNGQKGAAREQAPDPSSDEKEMMVLEARLEKASGHDRERIEELIRELEEKMRRDGTYPRGG